METEKILELEKQPAVTSLADSDVVFAYDSSGALRPVTFGKLAELVRETVQVGGKNLVVDGEFGVKWGRNIRAQETFKKDAWHILPFKSTVPAAYAKLFYTEARQVLIKQFPPIDNGVEFCMAFIMPVETQNRLQLHLYDANGKSVIHDLEYVKIERGNVPSDCEPLYNPEYQPNSGGGENCLTFSKLRNRIKAILEPSAHQAERRAA